MSPPNQYTVMTDAKRLATLAMYRSVAAFQPDRQDKKGVVVLAGTEAGEMGCLRYLYQADPNKVWFIDNYNNTGLIKVRKQWPKANVCFGEVGQVVHFAKPASFINLDFCGYVHTDDRPNTINRAGVTLGLGGLLFITFSRGRETGKHRKRISRAAAETYEGKRFLVNAKLVQAALGHDFIPVFSLRYSGQTSGQVHKGPQPSTMAMAILGFQKVDKSFQRNAHWMRLWTAPSPYGGYVPTDEGVQKELLRYEAESLFREGFTPKEVGTILTMKVDEIDCMISRSYNQ